VRPTLVTNPRQDAAFLKAAEALVRDGIASPDALERALRLDYPGTRVRARDLSSEPRRMWYVYRDGHWISGRERPW
jgi:hypothetical protein